MDLHYVLYIYLFVVVTVIVILCKMGFRPWGAVILALIGGLLFINIIFPPHSVDDETVSPSGYAFYMLIQLGTLLVIIVYAIIKALHDRIP